MQTLVEISELSIIVHLFDHWSRNDSFHTLFYAHCAQPHHFIVRLYVSTCNMAYIIAERYQQALLIKVVVCQAGGVPAWNFTDEKLCWKLRLF